MFELVSELGLQPQKLARGGPGSRRLARVAVCVVLISTLLAASPTKAGFDGTVENLAEGYLLYQAVSACPLKPSDGAMDILKAEIKRFEATTSESKRQELWDKAGADMPRVQALGVCEVLGAELQLLEMVDATNNPPPAGPKPQF